MSYTFQQKNEPDENGTDEDIKRVVHYQDASLNDDIGVSKKPNTHFFSGSTPAKDVNPL